MSNSQLIPPGYKQTEVGVIPEDWECTSVSQLVRDGILEKPLDGNHGNIHPKSGDFVSFGIPFVMANNVRGGRADLSNCAFIRKEQADSLQKGFSRPGDVLLTHKATIGNTAVVGEIPFEYIMLTPQVTYYRVADRTRLSNLYLRQFFDSFSFQAVLLAMSGGGTRAYIGITAQLQLPVALPPTKAEQEAIAEALSDADALIESLEQLLVKKRQLKQGAMQELLTGKKRLPGFSGEWETKRLGELANIQRGASPRPIDSPIWFDENSSVGWVRISDVTKSGMYLLETTQRLSPLGVQHSRPVSRGNLIMSICATVGRPIITEIETCIHDGFVVFDNLRTNKHFLYYILQSIEGDWSRHGQTGSQMNLNTGLINQTEISVPPTLPEQTAIAAILSDMDTEIAALETKLTKARQIKQGMMQELLTGKIRLI